MSDNTTAPVLDFLNRFAAALQLETPVDLEMTADGPRLNYSGEQAELLVRHRGEPLKALQHVVDMAYGRRLADDTIDTLLFFIANQNPLSDNVNASDVPPRDLFPFFGHPQQPRDSGVDDNTRN